MMFHQRRRTSLPAPDHLIVCRLFTSVVPDCGACIDGSAEASPFPGVERDRLAASVWDEADVQHVPQVVRHHVHAGMSLTLFHHPDHGTPAPAPDAHVRLPTL